MPSTKRGRIHEPAEFQAPTNVKMCDEVVSKTLCPIFSRAIMMAIDNNADRWRQVHCELVPGRPWDFRVDIESFHDEEYAKEYLSIVLNIIKYAGGGIPLIVESNLKDNWQQQLNNAAEKPLGNDSLTRLAATLGSVPIYVTGDKTLVGAPADVEGKVFWTLSSEQFSPHNKHPDLTQVRLLIYVKELSRAEDSLRVYRAVDKEDLKGFACKSILGSGRVGVREMVHALRWRWVFLNKVFEWILMNEDWNISMEQMKRDAATPAKLVGYGFDGKKDSEFPADAGRLWENSVTRGNAIFEGDFCLIGVAVARDSSSGGQTSGRASAVKETVYSETVSNTDALAMIRDPRSLVSIARKYAERLSVQCLSGYTLANYVTCSTILRRYPYQCQSSGGWMIKNCAVKMSRDSATPVLAEDQSESAPSFGSG